MTLPTSLDYRYAESEDDASEPAGQLSGAVGGVMTPPYSRIVLPEQTEQSAVFPAQEADPVQGFCRVGAGQGNGFLR